MLETIKSYLVSLGFSVDKNSYNEATKSMDNAEKVVSKFTGSASTKFAIAAAAVASFAAAANVGLAKFVSDLAQADLANEKLARQMWTSKENAAAYNNTLKAMGVTLQDLYLSPELMHNFELLRKQTRDMRPPAEFYDQMKLIRSIQYEFTRMKLEATYALQWIGYYLIKYMGGPIREIKLQLNEINNTIIKTMPHWTKVVAQVMSWFGQFGVTTVRAIKDIARIFDDIGEKIPKNLKLIGAAVAALGLIIQAGPIGLLLAAMLLLDDFYTYLNGGESKLGPFWKKIVDFYDKLKDSGAIDKFKNGIKQAFETAEKVIEKARKILFGFYDDLKQNGTLDNLKETFENVFGIIEKLLSGARIWVKDLFGDLEKSGVLKDLQKSFEDVYGAVSDLLKTVTGLIDKLLGLDETKKTLGGIGEVLNGVIIIALKIIAGLMEEIAGYINAVSAFLGGKSLENAKKSGEDAKQRLAAQPNEENRGYWGNMLQTSKEMFSDTFTGGTNFRDKLSRALGVLASSLQPGYIQPQSSTQNNSNKVTLSQTNNIYGSDPQATADAAHDNMEAMYLRNMRGAVR